MSPSNGARRAAVAAAIATIASTGAARPALAEPDAKIVERAQGYKQPALDFLKRMVDQDSGSGDEAGLVKVADLAIAELTALGAKVETQAPAEGGKGKNVIATLEGSGGAKILMMAHLDTVFREGDAAKRPFRIDGARAYGPGVMDDKGGIAIGTYALKILKNLDFKGFGRITLLLNSSEEIGSPGARKLIEEQAKAHDLVLNLEPGRAADGLVISRKGSGKAIVTVKGKSSHAGVAPEKGRNAATELAHQTLQVGKLGDKEKGTTVNVTVLKAGTAANIIPEDAEATADVRVAVTEEFDRVERDLKTAAETKLVPETVVTTRLERNFPPMAKNPATDGLAEKAQAIYGELGKKLTLESSGGAADASIAAGVGTPTIDGLGVVGGEIHTPTEYAEVESVVPRLYLLTRLVMEVGAGK
ncbi:glutamate carboxypeptidase [Methylopila sp. M107]|uniref:glutamate carboxypeptidase n=1 Tax=Methylopila sp. M107 TaxID=1101190 RepID=UPI0003652028|nr:glutamate carboxypeptidase [Methylopila sp. M107]